MDAEKTFQKSSNRVGIVTANHTGYVEAIFACMEAGDIAVPLRDIDDQQRISAAGVNRTIAPTNGKSWMARTLRSPETDAIALVSFTSGTEGKPKGVILTHSNLANVVTRLNSLMRVDNSISEYIGVPVYHSFGFGRCRAVATAGGRFFLPSNGFNPSEIGEMLKKGELNAISAVPSLWRVLLANKDLIGSYGQRVRWIEIGSQYMSRSEKEALKALFPAARIVQHYGLTEASRTTLLEIHEAEGDLLESVGQASGGIAVKLTQEGQIAIRGGHVAAGYLINGELTKLQDEDGWLITKDLGHFEDGYLYYEGRSDDVINCSGIKIHPEALETKVYASIGYGSGLAICRRSDPMRGEGLLVAVTKDIEIDKQQLREAVLRSTQELGVNAANAITIIDVDSLPKTPSGKVQRKKLSEWYALQDLNEAESFSSDVAGSAPIHTALCRTLNLRKIQPQDTFISLGGDSLTYVQLSMELERYLGYLPHGWEGMPFSELENLPPQHRRYTVTETSILLRALAITGVVLGHAGLPAVGGGSMLLLLIAGANFARFQGGALLQGLFMQPVLSLLRNLLFPYLAIALPYQIYKQDVDLSVLLLVSNLFIAEPTHSIFPVWFIEVLAQLILLFSLPFSIRSLRNLANSSPWRFGLIILGFGVCAYHLIPSVWNTDYLYNRVPHKLLWLFALGWCIHFAQSRSHRIATTVVFLAAISIVGNIDLKGWWIVVGGLLLIWLQYVSIPKVIKSPLQMISASAYYIYLSHIIFIYFVKDVVGVSNPLINAAIALLGGALMWAAVQAVQQFFVQKQWLNKLANVVYRFAK